LPHREIGPEFLMGEDEKLRSWAEFLLAQYGASGVCLQARHGVFDPAQGEAFCDMLDQMELPKDARSDRNLERRFVARLWYIPTFLERNTYQIAKGRGDVWRYRRFIGEVLGATHFILSTPDAVRLDEAKAESRIGVIARSYQGIADADFIAAVEEAFASSLSALGFRRVKARGDYVRYESDGIFLAVRYRRHHAGPSVDMGLTDPVGTGYRLGDVMEAHLGPNDFAHAFINGVDSSCLLSHMQSLANLAMTHCRAVLEGRPDAVSRIETFHAERSSKMAQRIIAYEEAR
jgi:hypothetical protein